VIALAHRRATGGAPSTPTTTAGPSGRSRLVLLHGFTQTSRCWAPIDEALAVDHDVVAVDLPGHGRSSEVRADLWGTADLVAATLAEPAGLDGAGSRAAPSDASAGSEPESEGRTVPDLEGAPRPEAPPAPGPFGEAGRERERGLGSGRAAGRDVATGREGATGSEGEAELTGPVTLVGYSMGGRVALHLALAHPEVVERLVLVGATPGIEDDADRGARRRADEALADHIEAIGVPAFLDEWLALPLFAGLTAETAHRTEREANTAAGLASSLRLTGTGTQEPLWERLGELTTPTLLVTGARDEKFTDVARRMLPLLGGPVEHVVVPDAGHTAHLERPDAFLDRLRAWLAATS
jgi:2-succinyl-6-hydroxy-2,4-cyclohexadiene-1-carboxylate synthase